jgi:hypothetical protein
MPATSPRRPERWWHDVVIVIIKCVTTLTGEWIRRGGHF